MNKRQEKKSKTGEQSHIFKSSLVQGKVFEAEEIKALCEASGIVYEPGDEDKVVQFIASDEKADREGDVMRMDGMDDSDFKKNPQFLFVHDYGSISIGSVIKRYIDKSDSANPVFEITVLFQTITDEAKDLCALTKKGVLKAVSIGFRAKQGGIKYPTEAEREALGMRPGGVIYLQWELVEISLCPIGMNPRALKKAAISQKTFSMFSRQKLINISNEGEIDMNKEELQLVIREEVKSFAAIFDPLVAAMKSGDALTADNIQHLHDAHKCMTKSLGHLTKMMLDHPDVPEDGEDGGKFSATNKKSLTGAMEHATKAMLHMKTMAYDMADPDEDPDDTDENEEGDDEGADSKKKPKKSSKSNLFLEFSREKGFIPGSEIEQFNSRFTS